MRKIKTTINVRIHLFIYKIYESSNVEGTIFNAYTIVFTKRDQKVDAEWECFKKKYGWKVVENVAVFNFKRDSTCDEQGHWTTAWSLLNDTTQHKKNMTFMCI